MAKLYEKLINVIKMAPDAPIEQLSEIVTNFSTQYGFTQKQKELAHSLLSTYLEKHELMIKVRKEYPNGTELFKALFGREPKGKVDVKMGTFSLYFQTPNLEDYTCIYQQLFTKDRDITDTDIKIANRSGGCCISSASIKGLEWMLTAGKGKQDAFEHEEQHGINNGIFALIPRANLYIETSLDEFATNLIPKEKYLVLNGLRQRRIWAEERAKDEIFAYFKDGDYSPDTIFKILTKSEKEGGLYDYLSDEKRNILKVKIYFTKEDSKEKLTKPEILKHFKIFKKLTQKVYGDEYQKILKEGINAFKDIRQLGYSIDETIAIFIYEPLSRWPKIAKRFKTKQEQQTPKWISELLPVIVIYGISTILSIIMLVLEKMGKFN